MEPVKVQYLKTAYGELVLGSYRNRLCLCDWRYRMKRQAIDTRIKRDLNAEYVECDDDTLLQARQQLAEYFRQQRNTFDIPLLMVGTEFQRKVWHGLLEIPYGSKQSYLQLAQRIATEKAVRAVAGANGANAISIFVPCHRVVGNDGQLTGYAGGVETKQKLLNLESDLFAA